MTNEEKIIAAIQKSGLNFNYLIMCDDNGRPIGIKNRDVYSSIFGKHTNDYNQNLDLDPVSNMTVYDITIEILKKWGVSKAVAVSQAAATLGRMTSERKKKTSAENGRKSKNGGRPPYTWTVKDRMTGKIVSKHTSHDLAEKACPKGSLADRYTLVEILPKNQGY